jgi:Bacterial Ig-like domain
MTRRARIALAFTATLSIAQSVGNVSTTHPAAQQATQSNPDMRDGQSATLLPDGTWLLIGGREQGRPSNALRIWDPATGRTELLQAALDRPRAGHTATVLSDGRVLILGGVDAGGRVEGTAEILDRSARRFESVTTSFMARASHTTTLMTDGRLLIAGGVDEIGQVRSDAAIWDPASGRITELIHMNAARHGYTATLLVDGSVSIEGGSNHQAERFHPESESFVVAASRPAAGDAPRFGGSLPDDGAIDVPVETVVALRFSQALDVRAVNTTSVTITGPAGQVPASVHPAEQGRLVFVSPVSNLDPATTYTVSVVGDPQDARTGPPALLASIAFTTRAAEAPRPPTVDDDAWIPDATSIARGWRTDKAPSPWQKLPPLEAPPGVTALSGQVLLLTGAPLANVTLEIEGRTARTDATGRFLLLLPGLASARRELVIDGTTANTPGRTYGVFEYGHRVSAGRTNVLLFTIWMPRLDTAHAVTIPSPTNEATVVTTPLIPGLELHLAPRTVIRDRHGAVVRQLSITPIPVDRPPFPLPRDAEVPIYFTIQPGGAYVHVYGQSGVKGARLVYPNYTNRRPGGRSSPIRGCRSTSSPAR